MHIVYSLLINNDNNTTTSPSIFILSYERRNVPMDLVFQIAFEKGFELIPKHDELIQIDHLYIFQIKK